METTKAGPAKIPASTADVFETPASESDAETTTGLLGELRERTPAAFERGQPAQHPPIRPVSAAGDSVEALRESAVGALLDIGPSRGWPHVPLA